MVNDGCNPAGDEVPIFSQAEGDDRLDVQDILNAVIRPDAEVPVVLKWNAVRLAMGFWDAFLKVSAFVAADGVASVATV